MSNEMPQKSHFLVYESGDGTLKIDVRLEDETVWLTQRLMADLFQKDVRTISEHIQNVYDEEELDPESTIRKFRTVRNEGSRQVQRQLDYYNLDMIISVGYRVKSRVATRFRQWVRYHRPEGRSGDAELYCRPALWMVKPEPRA